MQKAISTSTWLLGWDSISFLKIPLSLNSFKIYGLLFFEPENIRLSYWCRNKPHKWYAITEGRYFLTYSILFTSNGVFLMTYLLIKYDYTHFDDKKQEIWLVEKFQQWNSVCKTCLFWIRTKCSLVGPYVEFIKVEIANTLDNCTLPNLS